MSTVPIYRFTPYAFYAWEAEQPEKHMLFHGEAFAMAGASFNHARIVKNLLLTLTHRLGSGDCEAVANDVMVHAPAGLDTYPDVLVICGPPEYADQKKRVVTNPRVIIEVLSPSTEFFDRGQKYQEYKSIPSFVEYLLVSQERPWIEQFSRQSDNTWNERVVEGIDAEVTCAALGCQLPLAEIFARVEFPPIEDVINRLRLFNAKPPRDD